MKIQINIPMGGVFPVEVEPTDTVLNLKQKISTIKGLPLHPQYLLIKGKTMQDLRTLASYKIQEEQVIFLVFRLRR